MQERLKKKAIELLKSGTVDRVLGWKSGEFFYDLTPAVFETAEEVERDFRFSPFSGANLSKYCIAESRKGGKVAVFLKPCDSFS
ncbi:MAG TPA: 4Fe-4S ferredoxin, partial [Candidatus Faecousia faecipullorum]|nr:4Fe-4S ferredoxin [Candidatus Faecousia faecipullorum]